MIGARGGLIAKMRRRGLPLDVSKTMVGDGQFFEQDRVVRRVERQRVQLR
jgi:hypothetical protein